MSEEREKLGMGWLRDLPDFRDYTPEHSKVKSMLEGIGLAEPKKDLSNPVDLREWCSPIEDQGDLGSCTAQAGVALVEYYERRAFRKHIDASRLFLYKVTRNLLELTGDTGAYLRTTMGALVLFGVPPERYWRYRIDDFDVEPPAFCYSYAQSYQAIRYYRLDPPGISGDELLTRIKGFLKAGFPAAFGFPVYSSIWQASGTGDIPFPAPGEKLLGGHAVVAVGYKDDKKIANENPGGKETTGAILIRNSWGTGWGSNGYGYLPYRYVTQGGAVDWWTLIRSEWIDEGKFGL